jgi:hypothetical protein
LVFASLLCVPPASQGAGFAHDANFIVLADDQSLAEEVLARAGEFRRQVALDWLGSELPDGAGPVIIHVEISEREDKGLTWAVDHPGRTHHKLWLTTSRQRATGSSLAHEITHCVLASAFTGRLPPFVDEGVAGLRDGPDRRAIRRRILARFAADNSWPSLERVLNAAAIAPSDQAAYSVACSLTEFLLARGSDGPRQARARLFAFAQAGRDDGWDLALQAHYGLASVGQLEQEWRAWVVSSQRVAARAAGTSPAR